MAERLTLGEAIKHCEEKTDCTQCGEEHRQLAEWLKELQKYKDLEEQGRLITLPCKIGDTVYVPLRDNVQEYKVVRFDIDQNITIVLEIPAFHITFGVLDRAFGKTVFLTKEEAKAALKGAEE